MDDQTTAAQTMAAQTMAAQEEAESDAEERHATWLELFFDLLFVALVSQLAHGLVGGVTPGRIAHALALFVPTWWAWVSFTVFSNVAASDRPERRVAVLANMACLIVLGGGIAQALHGHPGLFALGYALSRVARTAPMMLAKRRLTGHWPSFRHYANYLASAALWAVSAAVHPSVCYWLWVVGLAVEIVPTFLSRVLRAGVDIDAGHISERFGLFVIIALGEGIAQIVAALNVSPGSHEAATLAGVAGFALLAVIWWLYFDFGNAAALRVLQTRVDERYRLARDGFVLGHFFLVGGIMAMAAGLGSAIGDVAGTAGHGDRVADVRLVCGGLLLYLTNNAVLGTGMGDRVRRVALWWLPTAAMVALVLTFAHHLAPGTAFAVLAAGVAVLTAPSIRKRRRESPAT